MKVTVQEILEYNDFRKRVNDCDVRDLILIRDGKEHTLSDEVCDYWKYTGLNNISLLRDWVDDDLRDFKDAILVQGKSDDI